MHLPRLRAQRLLRELRFQPDVRLSADEVFDLVLAATEDPAQAEQAFLRHRHNELRSGRTPV